MQSFPFSVLYIGRNDYICNLNDKVYEKTEFAMDGDAPALRNGNLNGMFIK